MLNSRNWLGTSKWTKPSWAAKPKTGTTVTATVARGAQGRGKRRIVGAVQRKGTVVARVIANVKADTLTSVVNEAVSHHVSGLVTDQWMGYRQLGKQYPHQVSNHAQGQ